MTVDVETSYLLVIVNAKSRKSVPAVVRRALSKTLSGLSTGARFHELQEGEDIQTPLELQAVPGALRVLVPPSRTVG